MTTHLKTYPDALRQLFVSCSIEETNDAFEQALTILQKSFSLSGYRKGKVPTDIIAKSNPPELMNIVSDILTQKAMSAHINDQALYGQPRFNPIGGLSRDKEFMFSLVYEIYPTITKDIKVSSLKLSYEACEIDQKFVEDTMCRQINLLDTVTGEVQDFDIVKVEVLNSDYKGDKKEATFDSTKLNSIVGKKSDETFNIAFDDLSGYLPEFLGKVSDPLEVKVIEIQRSKEWSKVTDEEIAEKTPFKTKDEYKKSSEAQFESFANQYNSTKKAEVLSNTVGAKLKVELPKSLWLNNIRDLVVKTAEKEVLKEEVSLDSLSSHKDILNKFSRLPIDSVEGLAFIIWLENIAEQQKLTVDGQELEYYYYRYAQSSRIPIQEFKKQLSNEDKASIRNEAIREKAMTHLLETLEFEVSGTVPLSEAVKNFN